MKDAIKNLSERIEKTKSIIQTEEATKNAYIMPFLQLLGYDVFNPLEIVPDIPAIFSGSVTLNFTFPSVSA